MNHDTSDAIRNPLPDEATEEQPGSELPPYTGELTICIKCSNTEAFTTFRPASERGMWEYNGRTMMRGPLPEHLERTCQRCDFQWDEALRPADGVRPLDVAELAYVLTQCAPYPLGREAAEYTAVRLLGAAHILLRPEHPLWNQPPAPPVHEQVAAHTDPNHMGVVPMAPVPDPEPTQPETAPVGLGTHPVGSEQ
ncbi:hypothetical protein [Streptomyces kronopolitis]|uniref:hypothetical protein n=1 Tax=Streptomyces kronopolitis TaxID=1612435 RepID=UPI003D98100C